MKEIVIEVQTLAARRRDLEPFNFPAQSAPEDETVKPRKGPHDILLIFLYKGFHGGFLSTDKFLAGNPETDDGRKTPAIF